MEREYQSGDVVQLNEKTGNAMLKYCFMTVTEPKSFGAMGFVQCTGTDGKPGAPYMWIVFVGDNPTAYYGLTLDAALNFIKQFE